MGSGPTLNVLQGYLKLITDRQQMIVSNMANVDTPGYHTKDVDFKSAQLQFQLGVQLVKSQFSQVLTAIKES
jgi:flagellar basal body rod protein FlgB